MKITMLGTGTGLIRPERRSPAVLLETKSGDSAVVDCGWGVPGALSELGFALHTLGHLCITHSHADHMSALPALLQSTFIANIPHLPGKPRSSRLTVHGYPGITKDVETLGAMMVPELNVTDELKIVEHGRGEILQLGSFAISAISVAHVPTLEAVSFRFEADGQKVIVSGDLGWDEAIVPFMQAADVAIMDASASQKEFEASPHRSHLAPVQCGLLAAQAGVKHLVLTSLYDRESPAEIEAAVRQNYQGMLTIPHDLQVLFVN